MSITTTNIKLYSFSDLAADIQEQILDNYWDSFHENYDYHATKIIDQFKEQQKKSGFIVENAEYAGFHHTGSGASFTGKVKLTDFIVYNKLEDDYGFLIPFIEYGYISDTVNIKRHPSSFVHELTCVIDNINVRFLDAPSHERLYSRLYSLAVDLRIDIEDDRHNLCVELYEKLKYDYLFKNSSAYIVEQLDANGFLFNKNGDRVDHLTD